MNRPCNRRPWLLLLPLLLILPACEAEPETAPEAPAADTTMADTTTAAAPAASIGRFNLNTATEAEFETIPGVGDRMVHEFMEYRPYVSIRQFRQEIGKYVDEAQVAAYERYVYVPVDPNESDAETLQQMPGVSAEEAAELIVGRPYDSNEAFLDRLAALVSQEQLALAEAYLQAP